MNYADREEGEQGGFSGYTAVELEESKHRAENKNHVTKKEKGKDENGKGKEKTQDN